MGRYFGVESGPEKNKAPALDSSKASLQLLSKWQCPMASGNVNAVLLKQRDRHHLREVGCTAEQAVWATCPHEGRHHLYLSTHLRALLAAALTLNTKTQSPIQSAGVGNGLSSVPLKFIGWVESPATSVAVLGDGTYKEAIKVK